MSTLIVILGASAFIALGWFLHSELGGRWCKAPWQGREALTGDSSHLRIKVRGEWMRFTDDQLSTAREREQLLSVRDRERED